MLPSSLEVIGKRLRRTWLLPRSQASFEPRFWPPGPTTLQGSHLDFILASTSIASALRLEANWEVPWKPHCALALQFDCSQAALPVQQLQRFPPVTRNYHPKNLWTSFTEDDGPFHILGQNITGLGEMGHTDREVPHPASTPTSHRTRITSAPVSSSLGQFHQTSGVEERQCCLLGEARHQDQPCHSWPIPGAPPGPEGHGYEDPATCLQGA